MPTWYWGWAVISKKISFTNGGCPFPVLYYTYITTYDVEYYLECILNLAGAPLLALIDNLWHGYLTCCDNHLLIFWDIWQGTCQRACILWILECKLFLVLWTPPYDSSNNIPWDFFLISQTTSQFCSPCLTAVSFEVVLDPEFLCVILLFLYGEFPCVFRMWLVKTSTNNSHYIASSIDCS